jgi:hypothetical protein
MTTALYSVPPDRPFVLTKDQNTTLVHCLRLAATKFHDDALSYAAARLPDIGQVLMRRAAEARELADRLADAEYVKVGSGRKPYDRDPEDEEAPR